MERPILDLPVPYVGAINTGAFKPGRLIRIQGNTPGVSYRFDVNLQCGPETLPRDDIAMQVSVRILDGLIAINSLQNGVWGEEQQGSYQPVRRAEKFEMLLLCEVSRYKVAINGQHFADFHQRIHYDCITHLTIEGDVSISKISYESASAPTPTPVLLRQTDDDFEIINHNKNDLGFVHPPSYSEVAHGLPPYPIHDVPGMPKPSYAPYPTGVAGTPYSQPGVSGVSPPPGVPIPLNAGATSNFRVEKSAAMGKVGIFVCMLLSIILGIILLTMVMFTA